MTPVLALLLSVLSFSLMGVCVKSLGGRLPLSEVVLARSLISLAVSQVLLQRQGLSPWVPGWPLLALRGLFGTLALYALFAAYAWLPLASVTVIQFLNPALTALLAWWCLGERPSRRIGLALLHVLPLSQLGRSNLPVADAAAVIVGPAGRQVITALALVSVLGLINASFMSAPRVLFGLARDSLFAPPLAWVHPRGTPLPALLVTMATTSLLVLLGDFDLLLALSAFFYVALYGSGIAALLWLRLRQPLLARPFRVWGWPLTPLIVLSGSLAFLLAALLEDRERSAWALVLIAAGWPAQALSRGLNPLPPAATPNATPEAAAPPSPQRHD